MTIIFFIFGLIIGSFLNVVVYRLNAVESLLGRSHCPKCKKKIRWFDNLPIISFIILSAKCRDCGEKISWQYPMVELATGTIFALIGHYFFAWFDSSSWYLAIYYMAVFSLLMVIFVYDLKYMEIPMMVLWTGVVASLAYFIYFDWHDFALASSITDLRIVSGMIGGFVAFIFFFALAAYSKETWMGYGDAYIGLLSGLIVGWPGIVPTLMVSFAIGAFVSVILIIFRKKTMKSQVPFAPFLITSVLLIIMLPQIFPQIENYLIYF